MAVREYLLFRYYKDYDFYDEEIIYCGNMIEILVKLDKIFKSLDRRLTPPFMTCEMILLDGGILELYNHDIYFAIEWTKKSGHNKILKLDNLDDNIDGAYIIIKSNDYDISCIQCDDRFIAEKIAKNIDDSYRWSIFSCLENKTILRSKRI